MGAGRRPPTEAPPNRIAWPPASAPNGTALSQEFPQGVQDRVARTFWLPAQPPGPPLGRVVVITAGTSDLPVAREAVVTAQALGCDVGLLADVGVAGLPLAAAARTLPGRGRVGRSRRYGRGLAERGGWFGGLSGDRGADECWIWRGFWRFGAAVDDAQQLCGERGGGEHRQRLQGGLCHGADGAANPTSKG